MKNSIALARVVGRATATTPFSIPPFPPQLEAQLKAERQRVLANDKDSHSLWEKDGSPSKIAAWASSGMDAQPELNTQRIRSVSNVSC
jgi:hypothetical protein